jgi:hypothetical protein
MSFCFAVLMLALGAQWGVRYGCFAALFCGVGAALIGFVGGMYYWFMAEELGYTADRVFEHKKVVGVLLRLACVLLFLLPFAGFAVTLPWLVRQWRH